MQQAAYRPADARQSRPTQPGRYCLRRWCARFSGWFVLLLLGAIIVVLFLGGLQAFRTFGPAS